MVPSAAARGGKTTKTAAITTCSIKVPRSHVDIVIDKLHPSIHTILFGGGSSSSSNDDNNNSPINDECNDYNSRRACLVANANEALRILQAKRAHFGVKDKPLVRAALVVDYLCRNNATTNNDTTTSNECNYHRTAIPAATLATIAGFTSSKKDKQILEVMQTVLAEHLDDSSIGIRLATKQQQREVYRSTSKQHDDNDDSRNCSTGISRKRDASLLLSSGSSSRPKSKTTTTTTMNTTRTSILKPTNLVQELCITLGPSIPDAEYALAYAIDIFHFLAYGGEKNSTTKNDNNNNNNNNTFTTYELRRDMERHTRYYEAACFYLAVKKSEGRNGSSYTFPTAAAAAAASNKKKKKKATRKKKEEEARKDNNISSSGGVMQESQQLEEEDGDIDNENDERHLTELDVIRETNLLEGTFMTVLACIRDRIDGIVISFDFTRKRGVDDNSLGDCSSTKSGGSTLFDVAGEMKTRNRNSSSSNAIAITTTIVDNSLDNAFEQWKRVVLLEAKTAYKNTTMTNEVGRHQAAVADDDDNNCWLTHAADNVLRNYGFPL